MGCDIHLFAEVKIKGCWYLHTAPNIEIWYAMFEKMAGVRGEDTNAISPPKGMPENPSFLTQKYYDMWKGDAHSESWFNSKEIEQLEDWLNEKNKNAEEYFFPEKIWGYLFGSGW